MKKPWCGHGPLGRLLGSKGLVVFDTESGSGFFFVRRLFIAALILFLVTDPGTLLYCLDLILVGHI